MRVDGVPQLCGLQHQTVMLDASGAAGARRAPDGVLRAICVYAAAIGSPARLCGAMGSIDWHPILASRRRPQEQAGPFRLHSTSALQRGAGVETSERSVQNPNPIYDVGGLTAFFWQLERPVLQLVQRASLQDSILIAAAAIFAGSSGAGQTQAV